MSNWPTSCAPLAGLWTIRGSSCSVARPSWAPTLQESLPAPVTLSVEADLAFVGDYDHHKSDMIDAMIGEESQFHQTFAYFGQGVSIETAVLGTGWEDRLVRFDDRASAPAEARCLDPHDLVLAKLAAHREKDLDFCWKLARAGLVDLFRVASSAV